MALVSDIIKQAYREANLIPLGQTPSTNQTTEALSLLNSIIMSVIGNEAGQSLEELIIGGDFDQMDLITDYIPDNVRLVFNLEDGPIIMGLDPYPKDGQRFAIVDTSGDMSTNTVTFNANGRTIEGADSITISTDYMYRQWMFRSDTGNWVRIAELVSSDTFPFPSEFDDFFSILLAIRLNPRYGQSMAPETMEAFKRSRSQFRARYSKINYVPQLDLGLWYPTRYLYTNYDDFERGLFWLP